MEQKTILRFTTAGSVDDGKSTLIGRLLFDTNKVFEDQLAAIKKTTAKQQEDVGEVNLALLTDGLAAEREQGITIDVAYRYFSTNKRKFIIADTPGHEQYTRNMVTGASTANLSIVLVDARKGVLPQSKRHAFIANMLGIKHVVVCINKMDLVDFSEKVFNEIKAAFLNFAKDFSVKEFIFIPVSALQGDNVVNRSSKMPWYTGPSLLNVLEEVEIVGDRNFTQFRMPVQYVIRPHLDYRGYAGQIISGEIKVGDTVQVLPSGKSSKVKAIDFFESSLPNAFTPQSVVITLQDDIDISRGDVLVKTDHPPIVASDFSAQVCWMSEAPLDLSKKYLIKHGAQYVKAMIKSLDYKVNIQSFAQEKADSLKLNEMGKLTFKTLKPIIFDPYQANRASGAFIVIDELSNNTVAAGMIE